MTFRARLEALEHRLAAGTAARPWRVAAEAKVLRFLLGLFGDGAPAPVVPTEPPAEFGPVTWHEPARPEPARASLLRDLHEQNVAAKHELAGRLADEPPPETWKRRRGQQRLIRDLRSSR
jgi:hypothetical protein